MLHKHLVIICLTAAFLATSCSKKTTLPYFADLTSQESGTLAGKEYLTTIESDDELYISVTSQEPAATSVYNLPVSNPGTMATLNMSTQAKQATYIVDSNGFIDFPVLGKIQVKGLTIEEVKELITSKVSKDVKDPLVTVQIMNFTINVGGEVKQPGKVTVTRNRFSILDALAAVGDLTEYGERQNVLLIREENGERTYHTLDLTSSDVLTSPYYYVHQNDYIYVSPNKVRQENSKYNQMNGFKLSIISTIVSGCSVVASLIIALVAK